MAARSILTLALVALVATAAASPRSDPTAGRAVFTGATSNDPSSIALNPAALGEGPRIKLLFVALTTVIDQLGIDRRSLDPMTGALSPAGSIEDVQTTLGGTLAGVLHVGRYVVSGEVRLPAEELFPTGHEALRYHTLGARQRDLLVTIASSIRITSKLYFGAGLSHDNTWLRLRFARDTALVNGNGPRGLGSDCGGMPCGIENPEADERYDVDVRSESVSTSNLKVNIGILAKIYRDVWLGIAYHTPPGFDIQTELTGDVTAIRAPRDGGEILHGGSTVYVSYPASIDVGVRARLPKLLDLHVGGRWEDLSRMQSYDVRAYGRDLQAAGIPEWQLRARGMHDAFALWAGIEQADIGDTGDRLRDRFRFGARIGIETSALDDDRTTALTISPTSVTFDLGVQTRVRPFVVQLSYGLQVFPQVDVRASAFDPRHQIDCIDNGFDYSTQACAAVRGGYALPSAAGEYRRFQHAFRLGFRYERD